MKDKIVMTTFGQTLKDSLIDGEDNKSEIKSDKFKQSLLF